MNTQRWQITRRLILVLTLGMGVALAAKRSRKSAPDDADSADSTDLQSVPAQPAPPALPQAAALFAGPLPLAALAIPGGLSSISAQTCNACHWTSHDRWRDSAHAAAWSNDTFRLALDRVGDPTACLSCHLPLAVQQPRLAAGYIEGDIGRPQLVPNPDWDPTLMTEGVTCAVCHVRDGMIVTSAASAAASSAAGVAAPHPISVSDELGQSELCATCHQLTWTDADQPFYDTYGEWQRSAFADAGISCQDCHMPALAGNATATRFAATPDHLLPADPARALTILVAASATEIQRGTDFQLTVRLQNTGAGHSVPTGSPYKTWRVVLTIRDASGSQVVTPYTQDLAREIEDAPPWKTISDSRLKAGAELVIQHAFVVDQRKHAGTGTVEVAIYHLDATAAASSRWSPDKAGEPLLSQRIPIAIR